MDTIVNSREWFLDEEFWIAFRPLAFGPHRWDKAPRDVGWLLQLLNLKEPPARILDLCSGPGRYSLEFARRHFQVTAVDISETYTSELRSRAERADLSLYVDVICSDVRSFRRYDSFEAALCVGLSFGYCESSEDDLAILQNAYSSLRTGGTFAVEVPTLHWPETLGPWFIVSSDAGGEAFVEQSVTPDRERVESTWLVQTNTGIVKFPFSQRLYTADGIAAALESAGFGFINLYRDYEGNSLQSTTTKIIAVASKV